MSRSMKKFVFFQDLFFYFILTYMYACSLLLSSGNKYGTRPCWWSSQWDLNSLVFAVWMVFSWLWVYMEVSSLFFFKYVYLNLLLPFIGLWLLICVCVYVCVLEWFRVFSLCVWVSVLSFLVGFVYVVVWFEIYW